MVYGQPANQDSVEGWTGDISEIVVYHFLDGGGAVDRSIAVQGEYVNYFDLFYANEALNLSDVAVPLWEQDLSLLLLLS